MSHYIISTTASRALDEGEVLRWCIGWLEKLACGETVIVNLRADSDSKTAIVALDQARVLKRIAADLDQLSGRKTPTENIDSTVDRAAK